MGALLRRYWWPVWFSELVSDKPVPVRIFGEDLVLFRDGGGHTGLLDQRCPHRGASLELGRVEEDGLRCCYHGWKFSGDGRCLDMPMEPENTPLRDEVRHTAYPTREAAGLVFAYLGPEPIPVFPRYDMLFEDGYDRTVRANIDHCNWLQRAENSVDQLHAPVLHAAGYPELALKRAEIEWTREWYGVRAAYTVEGGQGKVSHFLFPSSNRYFGARVGEGASQNMNMRVPIDDTTTMTFGIRAVRSSGPKSILTTNGLTEKDRGVYERVDDGWWGIASREQDRAAQESQGLIADRTREVLGTSDRGVVMFRRMLEEALEAIDRGEDPPGVRRKDTDELIVFDAQQVRDGQLMKA
jgi:5,5'-dehydrodivanillate O-demethylase